MSGKGVVIDLDFAVLDGAELLFKTTSGYLKRLDGIRLDTVSEARHLAGREYADGLARFFATVKTKKTSAKAAREIESAFDAAVTEALPGALGLPFRNFLKGLTDKGVRVVLATRADLSSVAEALCPLVSDAVRPLRDVSNVYGSFRWETWRRACHSGGFRPASTLVLTGSAYGVKSALQVGIGAIAVPSEHVAYQDFVGASEVVHELSGKTVRKVLGALGISRA